MTTTYTPEDIATIEQERAHFFAMWERAVERLDEAQRAADAAANAELALDAATTDPAYLDAAWKSEEAVALVEGLRLRRDALWATIQSRDTMLHNARWDGVDL